MIHWIWLLLIVPAAVCAGFFVACLMAASKLADLQKETIEAQEEALEVVEERREFADMLRKKCLEVERLKREAKRKK